MAINYTVVERKNLIDPNQPNKFYASARKSSEMSLVDLAETIADMSTVTSIDTLAVLEALLKVIPKELSKGNSVKLGDFGGFYTTIKSNGSETEEDFTNSLIKRTKINFRPGHRVKNVLNNIQYSKIN